MIRNCLVFAGAAHLALAGCAVAQSALPIRDTVLANGLRVIVVENHSVPLVTIELDVKTGSFTESPDYNGLSHLYEHMFFKANRVIPTAEQYLRRIRQLGAVRWDGSTSEERVNYFLTVGVDSTRSALQFMADAIRHPLFQQDELIRERQVVTGEYDRGESNPGFHLDRAIDTLLWTHAYYSRKNVLGDRTVIAGATQDNMRTIQNTFYTPNNTALILAGDIVPSRGFRLAAQVFGDWTRGNDPFTTPVPNPPRLAKPQAVIIEQPVSGVEIGLKWHGPSVTADPKSTYAANLLNAIINKSTSKFSKRLVGSGVAMSASIDYNVLAHVGPISIYVETTPDKLLAAQRTALDEIAKFADSTYVSQAELEAAHQEVGVQALYEREQANDWAHAIGFWWSVTGLDYYRSYVENMQRVTRTDLATYARTYLTGKPYVVGVMLNRDARSKLALTPQMLLPNAVAP